MAILWHFLWFYFFGYVVYWGGGQNDPGVKILATKMFVLFLFVFYLRMTPPHLRVKHISPGTTRILLYDITFLKCPNFVLLAVAVVSVVVLEYQ